MANLRKISISGAIVDSAWDEPLLASYIDRGVLTPLSRVSAAFKEAAEAGDGIEVHVNSIGGDVLAGNQMLAEIQDFKGTKKIVLGGMAASMAANLVLLAGCRVEAHENSILLFHSARSEVEGAPDALRDEAKLLDSINAPMIARLKALGVPSETVDEGFKAGRQFSLSAEEALSYGIVAKIRPGAGPVPEAVTDEELQTLAAKDQRVAAYFDATKAGEVQAPGAEKPVETVEDKKAEVQAPVQAPEAPEVQAPAPEPVEDLKAQLAEARAAAEKSEANARSIQSATARKINDLEIKLKAATEALEALRSQTEKTISDLQADKRKIAADLADERANRARLVGGVIASDASETGIADTASFHAALDALPDASARVAFIRSHAAQIKALAARQGVNH